MARVLGCGTQTSVITMDAVPNFQIKWNFTMNLRMLACQWRTIWSVSSTGSGRICASPTTVPQLSLFPYSEYLFFKYSLLQKKNKRQHLNIFLLYVPSLKGLMTLYLLDNGWMNWEIIQSAVVTVVIVTYMGLWLVILPYRYQVVLEEAGVLGFQNFLHSTKTDKLGPIEFLFYVTLPLK